MSFEALPSVLVKYICIFLEDDIESFARFSITNKKHLNLFSHIPQIRSLLKIYFPKIKYFSDSLQTFLVEKMNLNYTLLHIVLQEKKKQSLDLIKFLVEKKSDLNALTLADNNTPLSIACLNEFVSVEKKTDLNLKNYSKSSPLHLACSVQHVSCEMIKIFINNKTDLNEMNSLHSTPLHLLCKNKKVNKECLKLLIEFKSEINLQNKKNYDTPLHCAVKNEYVTLEIIQIMIKNNADFNLPNKFGTTPLQNAFLNNNLNKEIKLKYGNDVSIESFFFK